MLDHQRMDVYQLARQLSRELCRISKLARPGRSDLKDQLLRANASVPLNIAEGSGEYSPGRKCYFYRIARSSATECSSAMEHMVDHQILEESEIIQAGEIIERIVEMLVRLIIRIQGRAGPTQQSPQVKLRPRKLGDGSNLIPRIAEAPADG